MLPDEFLSISQIARVLNISRDSARRRFKNHPAAVDVGPRGKRVIRRIPRSAILQFINERTGEAPKNNR